MLRYILLSIILDLSLFSCQSDFKIDLRQNYKLNYQFNLVDKLQCGNSSYYLSVNDEHYENKIVISDDSFFKENKTCLLSSIDNTCRRLYQNNNTYGCGSLTSYTLYKISGVNFVDFKRDSSLRYKKYILLKKCDAIGFLTALLKLDFNRTKKNCYIYLK